MVNATINMIPSPQLQPFVRQLWRSEAMDSPPGSREHVLPTGHMHLVFRLSGPALRVFADEQGEQGQVLQGPVIGGARSGFYAKELGSSVISIGAQLRPGAAQRLFGVSAAELAERHTLLCDLWGARAHSVADQMQAASKPAQQLQMLEKLLLAQLRPMKGLHPAVANALSLAHQSKVEEWVRTSQYSHRGFIALFKQATGLSPKRYARLMRFQKLLNHLRSAPDAALAELAFVAGYSDQAHMNREFREFAGVTPMQYRLQMPAASHHVALGKC